MSDVKLDKKILEDFIKMMKNGRKPQIQIGVFTDHNSRSDEKTNVMVGSVHEYGSIERGIPSRSFLKMPITTEYEKNVKNSKLFTVDLLKQVVKEKSLIPWAKRLATVGLTTVMQAFATGGFGQWVPWKNGYVSKTGMILQDTTQLRDSIRTRIIE